MIRMSGTDQSGSPGRGGGLFCRRCLGDAGLVWYADHRNHGETRPPTAAHVAAAVVS